MGCYKYILAFVAVLTIICLVVCGKKKEGFENPTVSPALFNAMSNGYNIPYRTNSYTPYVGSMTAISAVEDARRISDIRN